LKNYNTHIQKTAEQLSNISQLDNEILKKFKQHDKIIFCTMGKSAFACRKIVYTARSYGLDWHDLDVCHAFHGDAGIVKPGNLLVLVSKSGNTAETVAVAKYFSEFETISITSNPDSTLSRLCKNNIDIPVESECSPFGYAPMVSTTLYMVVLHAIMCEVIEDSNITIEDYARNHPGGSIGRRLANDKK